MANSSVHHRRRRGRAAPIGGVFIVLAIVGLIAVASIGFNTVGKLFDNSEKMAEFEKYLLPVVMFDPVPFDDPKDADQLALLQSALWSALYSDKRETYTYSDNGMLMVPVSDVEVECAKLYGGEIKLEHQSFGDMEINYIYNEELQAYEIPMMVQVGYYVPKVESDTSKGDIHVLKVGYVPPGNAWTGDVNGKTASPEPDKYMYYELKKVKGGYTILSIKYPPQNVSSSGNSQTEGSSSK